MLSDKTSRRRLLGGMAALCGAASMGGCFGLFGNGAETNPDSPARNVPGGAAGLLSVDFRAILNDGEILDGADAALERRREESGDGPTSVADALDRLNQRYGLDPREMRGAIGFAGEGFDAALTDGLATAPYWGVLGVTDWRSDEMVASFREASLGEVRERTHGGTTAYDNGAEWLAPLEDGRVVLGSGRAVRDAVDVAAGNETGVTGELREAFDATSGEYARFALDLDFEAVVERQIGEELATALPFGSIRHVSGAAFAAGGRRGLDVAVELESGGDAEQLATTVEGLVGIARGQGIDGPVLRRYEPTIQELEASANGKTTIASYRTDADAFGRQAGEAVADLLRSITL